MTKVVIVTYKLQPGKTNENRALIQAVMTMLERSGMPGVKYASVMTEDGLNFTHIASFADDAARQSYTESAEFQAFTNDIKSRCEIPPTPVMSTVVGSHNLF